MFCEKCGHKVNEGERFCQNCGAALQPVAPVQQAPVQEAPVQQAPVQEAPVQEAPVQQAPVQQAPVQQAPVQEVPVQEAPVQQQYSVPYMNGQQPPVQQAPVAPAAPAAPKQPMSPKTKKIILFSAIGAGVLAALLIVLFTVIIPMINNANKLDISKYITVELDNYDSDNPTVYDGAITGEFTFDYDKFIADQKLPVGTDKYETALYDFQSIADIEVVKKSGEKNDDDFDNYFYNAKSGDVFTVTIEWPTNQSGLLTAAYRKQLSDLEKKYGIGVNTENKTLDFKLGDLLSAQGITVGESAEANVLGYIKDNNLVYTDGEEDGKLSGAVKAFETTIGDYTFEKSDYSTCVYVYNKNGDEVTHFYLAFDNDGSNLTDGTTVTLDYDKYYLDDAAAYGILLTGDPVSYTLKATKTATSSKTSSNSSSKTSSDTSSSSSKTESATVDTSKEPGLSVEDAKKCVDQLETYLLENVIEEDDEAKKGDKIEVKNIYYVHDTDSSYRRIVFIYENTTSKYFRALETDPEDLTLNNGKLNVDFVYFSDSDYASTLADATENNWYLSKTYSEYYNNTKLK